MRKRNIAVLVALLAVIFAWRVIGQSLSPQQLLQRAEDNYQNNDFQAAYQDWDSVRTQSPGTQAGQKAEFEIAAMQASINRNFEAARTAYQRLSNQNQGTLAGIMADFSLLDMDLAEHKVDVRGYWNRIDGLVSRAGGPSLEQVTSLASDGKQQVRLRMRSVPGLDPQNQYLLLNDLYSAASGRYFAYFKNTPDASGRNHYQYLCSKAELERAIRLQHFVLQNWDFSKLGNSESSSTDSLQSAELSLQGLPPREAVYIGGADPWQYPVQDKRAPIVDKLVPRANSRVSAKQTIGFRISDGNVQQSQIALNLIQVTLDGIDVTTSFELQKRFYPRSKKGYLVVSGRSQATLKLTAGSHIVIVSCRDHDGNQTRQNWAFQVKSGGAGNDDQDCDDNDDDLDRD